MEALQKTAGRPAFDPDKKRKALVTYVTPGERQRIEDHVGEGRHVAVWLRELALSAINSANDLHSSPHKPLDSTEKRDQ